MRIDDKIRDLKLHYNITREAAKISALSSGKIDKYEYLIDKEILPSNQSWRIEQVKFTYSALEKALENQTKTIKNQGGQQIKVVEKQKEKQITAN